MARGAARWARGSLPVILVVAFGAVLRLYGLNWDGGQWLQPDERQVYFVALGLGWPSSLAQALTPASPLNPHFFAYGSLPIYLVRLVALLIAPLWPVVRDPANLHLVGRPLAALFDLGTIVLTYRLACRLWPPSGMPGVPRLEPNPADVAAADPGRSSAEHGFRLSAAPSPHPVPSGRLIGLLAAALVSLAVLHVQLAHFYTADPPLAFFVVVALNAAAALLHRPTVRRSALLGAAIGLALACKITAAPLLLVAVLALTTASSNRHASGITPHASRLTLHASRITSGALALFAAFILTQPYALIDWRAFVTQTVHESQIAWGVLDVPYTRQYAGTLPYLYSIWQVAVWGLGLPAGVLGWAGLGAAVIRWLRRGGWGDSLALAWAGPYLVLTGALHAKYLRYMLPLTPVLCLLAARLIVGLLQRRAGAIRQWLPRLLPWAVVLLSAAYALSFESLYSAPHSWIAASEWIYRHVPAGSALAVEAWDTALPLPLEAGGRSRRIEEYAVLTLPLYDEPDDQSKWAQLSGDLAQADYVIIASRRGYGSIGRLTARYPITSRYYQLLFRGGLGFDLAAEFTRGPTWLDPRLAPLPGAAPGVLIPDESFVVYDHPRVLVFRNSSRLAPGDILKRLSP